MPEQQGCPDAAGPHEHQSDCYVVVMNRKDGVLQFPELTDGPRLVQINLAGAGSASWHDRLQHWLGLEGSGDNDSLAAGRTQINFADGPEPRVRASLTLEVSHNLVAVIPLATGEICLIESTDRSS